MCGLCGALGGAEHWTEGAASTAAAAPAAMTATQARRLRARVASRVLAHYGLTLGEWTAGAYVLRGRTGRTAMVPHLGALWPAAERLAGCSCDPLDPELIRHLGRAPPGGA